MNIDPRLMHTRELKEKYIRFNIHNSSYGENSAIITVPGIVSKARKNTYAGMKRGKTKKVPD